MCFMLMIIIIIINIIYLKPDKCLYIISIRE